MICWILDFLKLSFQHIFRIYSPNIISALSKVSSFLIVSFCREKKYLKAWRFPVLHVFIQLKVAIHKCSTKKLFWKNLQTLNNTCAWVSFSRVAELHTASNFMKKETLVEVFSRVFLRNFSEPLKVTASI